MFILIKGGDVHAPQPRGAGDLLLAGNKIVKIGAIDRRQLDALDVAVDVIDADGCIVAPGLIDPHEHLLGGSGERGFSSQSPDIRLSEIVEGGITTVVGCLGVDTTTRTMPALLAKAKGLAEDGVTAYLYTGGYNVPPTTLTGSVRNDLLFVQEVIGAGEIAISDLRSTGPATAELARLARDAYAGGLLARKAGVTHIHVGEEKAGLAPVRALLDDHAIDPALLYPTHVQRNEALMREAIELTQRGVTIDLDVAAQDLGKWLTFFSDGRGDETRVTVSTDADSNSPMSLIRQLRSCVLDLGWPLARILPMMTRNTARVLKLEQKGELREGGDADVLVLQRASLEVHAVVAQGRVLLRDGRLQHVESSRVDSNRRFAYHGEKAESSR
jgi:beta-aspartyl-dipeptidase (metallo-type)